MSTTSSYADRVRGLGARGLAFGAVVLGFVVVALALTSPFVLLPFLGWSMAAEFAGHFVHDMALTSLLFVAVAGVLVQLYRPTRRVAAMQLAVIALAFVIAAFAFGRAFFEITPPILALLGLAVVAAALHPARGRLVRIAAADADRAAIGLVLVAAVPLAAYAYAQLNAQFALVDDHAMIGHYAGMAAASLFAIVAGLLAATATAGRRFAALATAFVVAWIGLASAYQPAQASALSLPWAVAAVLWAVAFVAVVEYDARRTSRRLATGADADVATATP